MLKSMVLKSLIRAAGRPFTREGNYMKRMMLLMVVMLLSAGVLGGCNTMHGAGEDISDGGQAIQNAAD
ncbi:Predicted small secreted protein [Kushneria avicenniae]|uniref:Predicted small secreted protein n=1 Tax=Kushneria avicenniae TaxID=402385 RepID=A0A1I1LP26_9GAMM|nr:Predicted small secreted protein [Kushneria avicenniae]